MDKKLLDKFIANRCTSKEIDGFFEWLEKFQIGDFQEASSLRSYWDAIEMKENPDEASTRRQLDRIHNTILSSQSKRIKEGRMRFFAGVPIVRLMSRAAAILLLPVLTLLLYALFFQPGLSSLPGVAQTYEIVSPPGARTHFELPDGTKVWLNQESKMIYPHRFAGGVRTVRLTGEGYFDVAPDKKKPFVVEARGMAVKAVGTSFNVKAYADGSNFETTLESGQVTVLRHITERSQPEICRMEPGEHFVFNEMTKEYTLKAEDPSRYVLWKEGKLVFKDDYLDQVAERLSRWYHVKVTLKDTGLKSLTYTGTFIDETLDQVLEMMEIVTPISYTVSDRRKLSDGTFSEKEILIVKKGGKTN